MAAESVCSTGGELSCSVCLESFQEPKVLPCCHSFCLKCLEGTLERAKDKNKISCPQCRTQHEVPLNGVHGFLDDYTVPAALDKTTSPPSCQQCSEGVEAVTYCLTCSHLCEECHQAHKKFKIYRNHKIMDKEQLATSDVKPKRTYHCRTHPDNILTLYCKTCQSVACTHCHVTSHNGHDIGYISTEKRNDVERLVGGCMTKVGLKLKEFEQNLRYVTTLEKNETEGAAPLKTKINAQVDSMIAQLEARRKLLLKKVDDFFSAKLKELWVQKEYQEISILRMKSALTFTEKSLQCKDDTEALALCTQVLTRLKELSQLKWDSESTEDIEVTCALWEPDTADLNTVGVVKSTVCTPVLQIISNDVPDSIQPDQKVAFRVTAEFKASVHSRVDSITLQGQADCSGKEQRYSCTQEAYRNYPFNKSVTVKALKDSDNGWRVSCQPPNGTHLISLTLRAKGMYGRNIACNTVKHIIPVTK